MLHANKGIQNVYLEKMTWNRELRSVFFSSASRATGCSVDFACGFFETRNFHTFREKWRHEKMMSALISNILTARTFQIFEITQKSFRIRALSCAAIFYFLPAAFS